ncbi:hypothetical protein ACQPYA_04190 [Micromonospora sp. CA-263727]|uniref:hypothetical protein n=1 Tax=Micromonospora sp. CA-263727 TaxID=3239967 RepID=UPI003D950A4F
MTILLLHLAGHPVTLPAPPDVGRRVSDTRLERVVPCVRCLIRHLVVTVAASTPDTTDVPPGHVRP